MREEFQFAYLCVAMLALIPAGVLLQRVVYRFFVGVSRGLV